MARLRRGVDPAIDRYLDAIDACRERHGADATRVRRGCSRMRCARRTHCLLQALQAGEATALKANFAGDARVAVHARDGYAAIKALLPPKVDGERFARGLVLVDPPYEAQLAEFDAAFAALREGLARWPQAAFALWYPLKQRRALQPMLREAAALPAKSVLQVELLVRPDDSPLRMNGSRPAAAQPAVRNRGTAAVNAGGIARAAGGRRRPDATGVAEATRLTTISRRPPPIPVRRNSTGFPGTRPSPRAGHAGICSSSKVASRCSRIRACTDSITVIAGNNEGFSCPLVLIVQELRKPVQFHSKLKLSSSISTALCCPVCGTGQRRR